MGRVVHTGFSSEPVPYIRALEEATRQQGHGPAWSSNMQDQCWEQYCV
jgi:hypothetical protein